MALTHSSSGGVEICYVLPVFPDDDDVMFSHMMMFIHHKGRSKEHNTDIEINTERHRDRHTNIQYQYQLKLPIETIFSIQSNTILCDLAHINTSLENNIGHKARHAYF